MHLTHAKSQWFYNLQYIWYLINKNKLSVPLNNLKLPTSTELCAATPILAWK